MTNARPPKEFRSVSGPRTRSVTWWVRLLRFMEVSQERPEFAEELPQFVAEIKRIFDPHEIVTFFDDAQAGRVVDPAKIFNGRAVEDDELDESDVLYDAEKLLLIENAKRLLLPDLS